MWQHVKMTSLESNKNSDYNSKITQMGLQQTLNFVYNKGNNNVKNITYRLVNIRVYEEQKWAGSLKGYRERWWASLILSWFPHRMDPMGHMHTCYRQLVTTTLNSVGLEHHGLQGREFRIWTSIANGFTFIKMIQLGDLFGYKISEMHGIITRKNIKNLEKMVVRVSDISFSQV